MSQPVIAAEGLGFSRQGRPILAEVRFAARPGRVTALIGPNGAGKSTLLDLLVGRLTPDAGEIRLAGRPLSALSPLEMARLRACLRQDHAAHGWLTAHEVVALGRAPWRATPAMIEDRAAITRAMARTGVEGFGERRFQTLSGGERQRVQLARVLAQLDGAGAGRLLLLDEPTTAMDPLHQLKIAALMRGLVAEGMAVVAVVHDLPLVARLADDVVLLDQGRVAAAGPLEEVMTPAILARVFGIRARLIADPEDGRPQLFVTGMAD